MEEHILWEMIALIVTRECEYEYSPLVDLRMRFSEISWPWLSDTMCASEELGIGSQATVMADGEHVIETDGTSIKVNYNEFPENPEGDCKWWI